MTIAPAWAAGIDNNVEWNGISHATEWDRRPLCPVGGESFEVRFQTYADDLSAARVRYDSGPTSWVDASRIAVRGPYDIWAATIPATASSTLSYIIELTDGADTDYFSPAGVSDGLPGVEFEMNFNTLSHAPVGATPVTGGAVFRVWSPATSSAYVRGDFNNWTTANPMSRVGEDWIAFVPGAVAGQQYKYFFNNSVWKPDARGRRMDPTDNNNSEIIDPFSYTWTTNGFSSADFESLVIYQLHVGSFAGRNDPYGPAPTPSGYRDVGDRAAHLAELGINAVMLNPINEFPGDFSGGYNPVSAYAVEWRLGTPADLQYMVDQLHAHGIAVLLDIVWNHFSVSENFLWNYDGSQIYFDSPHVDTPWGAQADFDNPAVRDYFLDSVILMLDEYRMDGFRMDATDFMNMGAHGAAGWSLMQDLNDLMDRRYVDKINIAEQLPDDPWVTRPTSLGGAGFDAQYFDRFTDDLRAEVFDAAFGDPEMWKLRDIVNGGGQYLSGPQVVNYFELHDEAWDLSGGQRAVVTIDTSAPHDDQYARGRTTLAQGFTLLAPGIPAFLHGTEWLESEPFETKIDWSRKTTYSGVFDYYSQLVGLRTAAPALRADASHWVYHMNEGANVLAFERWVEGGASYVVIVNLSSADQPGYRLGLPRAGEWTVVLNNQAAEYGGSGSGTSDTVTSEAIPADSLAQSAVLAIPASGLMVLSHDAVTPQCADVTGDNEVDFEDLNALLNAWGQAGGAADIDGSGTMDFDDLNLILIQWGGTC